MQRTYRNPTPHPQQPARRPVAKPAITSATLMRWALIGGGITAFLFSVTLFALILGIAVIFGSGRILPGVSTAGIRLGGMTVEDATAQLNSDWAQITLRDGDRMWAVAPGEVGLTLDAGATALAAQHHGRRDGQWLAAVLGWDAVAPVVAFDRAAAEKGLKLLVPKVDLPAANATVRVSGGRVEAVPAADGRVLDVAATLERLASIHELNDGALDLIMASTKPTVLDATPVLEQARRLLASPLTVNAFDPIRNQTIPWTLTPEQWGQWLTTENTPTGPTLSINTNAVSNYLNTQSASTFTDGRYIDAAKGVEAVRKEIAAGRTTSTLQVRYRPTKYTVQRGDTIGTVAWKQGIMMWRIARANPGLDMDSLSPGQVITIPAKDDLLPLPVVPNKRIVVSITRQRMQVYENGQIKWDWPASTGIPDSPTAPGVFQILSREQNAYAGNWNLWMPYFMDIYEAVPGFMNGIHGFPSRNGQGILWEANLGTKVTFGCVMVSTKNAEQLFRWAENGVVIEIQG